MAGIVREGSNNIAALLQIGKDEFFIGDEKGCSASAVEELPSIEGLALVEGLAPLQGLCLIRPSLQ